MVELILLGLVIWATLVVLAAVMDASGSDD